MRTRKFPSALAHFIETRYLERLAEGSIGLDEDWSPGRHSDVAKAVYASTCTSRREHYLSVSLFEWRAPNEKTERPASLGERYPDCDVPYGFADFRHSISKRRPKTLSFPSRYSGIRSDAAEVITPSRSRVARGYA